mmetsp:Transcript_13748/g.37502  ORF Transcript_13748/g.37502 Transcript_13748/m.37502 type:complete len:105 (-) Transcript_13748:70-384(-)
MSKATVTEVAENHNWVDRVNSEINSQLKYATEWGATLKEKLPATLDEMIAEREAELKALKSKSHVPSWETTASAVGKGPTLEAFGTSPFALKQDRDLMPSSGNI